MIDRDFILPDGRNLKYHQYAESVIDFPLHKIKHIIHSRQVPDQIDFEITYVEVDFTEWSHELVDDGQNQVQTGVLMHSSMEAPPEQSFEDFRKSKSDQISSACRAQIYDGYDSDALGSIYHYPAKDRDQSNMIASVTDSYNPDHPEGWTTLFWCMDGAGNWALREHTATQIRKAGSDGKLSIEAAVVKNAELQAQIMAASTVEELNAIEW